MSQQHLPGGSARQTPRSPPEPPAHGGRCQGPVPVVRVQVPAAGAGFDGTGGRLPGPLVHRYPTTGTRSTGHAEGTGASRRRRPGCSHAHVPTARASPAHATGQRHHPRAAGGCRPVCRNHPVERRARLARRAPPRLHCVPRTPDDPTAADRRTPLGRARFRPRRCHRGQAARGHLRGPTRSRPRAGTRPTKQPVERIRRRPAHPAPRCRRGLARATSPVVPREGSGGRRPRGPHP